MSGARLESTSVTAPWVVKVGGRLVEETEGRARLARACADLAEPIVLVHGGGDRVSRMQQKLGRTPRFVEGRRVTELADVEVLEMVLSGSLNKALARDLTAAGRPAIGIAGTDAGLIVCEWVPELGRVGLPARVHSAALAVLLQANLVPVVAPVSLGPDGEPVNLNADECAAALAVALQSPRLLLLTDVEGVRVEDAWCGEVAGHEVEALIARGEVTGGMIPKMRAAAAATGAGVREVRIAAFADSLSFVGGTRVHADPGGAVHA